MNMENKRPMQAIPVMRVLDKLDSYLAKNDYNGAERHLRYWLSEAEEGGDSRGRLMVLNEMIGLFRKIGKRSECIQAISAVMDLAETAEYENTVTLGTTLINAATGYKAFGEAKKALPLYERAREIYESKLEPEDARLGGLYNNMALALTELENFRKAEELYYKAIGVMEKQEHGEPEMAITYLNMADLVAAEKGLVEGADQIEKHLEKAEELLNTEGIPRNGNYAFVCEKCAPVFGYYGYFLVEKELGKRAREIYEGS